MTRLRVGLLGAGKHGSRYAHHIAVDLSAEAELVGIWRRDASAGEAIARSFGCRFVRDARDLVSASDLDAVAIVVPPTLHAELCETAAGAGKAILLEKPMAPTLEAAARIRRAVDAAGIPFMVAHTLRFNAVVRALRERIDRIAPIQSLHLSQRFEPSPLPWLDRRAVAGGGITLHTGVHSFDLLRYFSGCEAKTAFCRMWKQQTRETEDNFVASIEMSDGSHATVVGSRSTQSRNGLIEISGANGQLVGDHAHGFAYEIHGSERETIPVADPVPTVLETVRAFVHALRAGRRPPISLDDGRAAVAIATACYRSAETARPVAVPTESESPE